MRALILVLTWLYSGSILADTSLAKTGDIIFIQSQTQQSQAIREGTHSEWTHVGIVIGDKVAEETSGVKYTPIKNFIARSKDKAYAIYRTKTYSKSMEPKLRELIRKYDKPYDIYFEWGNDRIYCSELVYKVFKDLTGSGIGKLQTFGDMDLEAPAVKALIKKRYEDTGRELNPEETIITPISQMQDPELTEIFTQAKIGLSKPIYVLKPLDVTSKVTR